MKLGQSDASCKESRQKNYFDFKFIFETNAPLRTRFTGKKVRDRPYAANYYRLLVDKNLGENTFQNLTS